MYVASVDNVEECEMKLKGALGVKVKYLLHKGVGAERLQLRLFTIDVGGYAPLEKHEHKHEVFMLRGKALVRGEETETVATAGYVIFIPSKEKHQFKNIAKEKLQFLCTEETVR